MSIGTFVTLYLLLFYSPAILLIIIGIIAKFKSKHKLASKLFTGNIPYCRYRNMSDFD